jgi:hypothetical protein
MVTEKPPISEVRKTARRFFDLRNKTQRTQILENKIKEAIKRTKTEQQLLPPENFSIKMTNHQHDTDTQ